MEDPSEDPNHELPSIENPNHPNGNHPPDDPILSELESLHKSYQDLRYRSMATEDTLEDRRIRDQDLSKILEEASQERDALRIKILELEASSKEKEEVYLKERFELASEVDLFRARASELLEERNRRDRVLLEILDPIRSVKEILVRIHDRIGEEKLEGNLEEKANLEDELETLKLEIRLTHKLGIDVESKLVEYEEMRKREKKELENSIVSLTEENRDINSLLRIALVEKEAVEKSLSRLKGSGEQKRVAILQIAERGLQKVGFGFMMGAVAGESQSDQPSSSSGSMKSDGSECEEEVVSMASTVEKIMKNLRLEINGLKRSLDGSRSDCEHLQILVDKQAQKITESTMYIKDLEERENMLAQNVEELMAEITEAGEEVARWREACELEVEAGKAAIEEREREVAMLREELDRTKAALDAANNKLMLKERLAATAMAAQAAAEASLRLADSRSTGLRERIEELTRQVEEEADRSKKERSNSSRRRVRHVCWPWRALMLTPTPQAGGGASRVGNRSKRMLPDMEALLHLNI